MENNKCKTCNGTGIEYDGAGHTCTACNGALVPPAGGEVEVIGTVAFHEEDGKFIDFVVWPKNALDSVEVGTELVDLAHVTRLQEGLKLEQDATIKWQETAITLSAERDALKAEVEELKNNMNSWMHCAAERLQMWTDSQSELTEARELLKLFRRALNGGGDQLSGMEHGKAFRDVTAFLAHQSAPAIKDDPVDGDVLPPVGSKVWIELASSGWDEQTVTGYYVWPSHGLDKNVHRVFVRVKDAEGTTNARPLGDVRTEAPAAKGGE